MITLRRVLSVALLSAVAVAAVGCGGSSGSGGATKVNIADSKFTAQTGQREVAISTVDNEFDPPYLKVSTGTKVTWTNDGRNTHNIVPTVTGAFQKAVGQDFAPGSSWSVTFSNAGDYPYYCSIHGTPTNGQNGVIRVVASK